MCRCLPQLLLYEHSKQKELPLRRYLPVFRISRFMAPIWESFIEEPHSPLLTTALIINEQRMLQERILKRTRHGEILRRLDFQLQEHLGFMKVIFPYENKQKGLHSLTGLTVERFADPKQRIETGKLLYGLLFQHPVVFRGVGHFTKEIPTRVPERITGQAYIPLMDPRQKMIKSTAPLFMMHGKINYSFLPTPLIGSRMKASWKIYEAYRSLKRLT
ncbi:DUF2515 family protein [Peribacillus frigoritolerans]|nr:DUF2515 family protein [Peribacillus frigoritolerans]